MAAMAVVKIMMIMVVVMMVMRMIPVGIVPTPMESVPIVRTVPIVVIIPPWAIISIIIRIIVTVVSIRVEAPVPGIAYIHVGVAAAVVTGVIVIVIIHGGTGTCAETFDTGRIVSVIISLGGGVNHAVGVGYGLRGLVNRTHIRLVVLAIGVVSLIVVGRTDTYTGTHCSVAVGFGLVLRRVIGVVVGCLFAG